MPLILLFYVPEQNKPANRTKEKKWCISVGIAKHSNRFPVMPFKTANNNNNNNGRISLSLHKMIWYHFTFDFHLDRKLHFRHVGQKYIHIYVLFDCVAHYDAISICLWATKSSALCGRFWTVEIRGFYFFLLARKTHKFQRTTLHNVPCPLYMYVCVSKVKCNMKLCH